jgi:prefoldin subunit 5
MRASGIGDVAQLSLIVKDNMKDVPELIERIQALEDGVGALDTTLKAVVKTNTMLQKCVRHLCSIELPARNENAYVKIHDLEYITTKMVTDLTDYFG